jgi:hypothetical protein
MAAGGKYDHDLIARRRAADPDLAWRTIAGEIGVDPIVLKDAHKKWRRGSGRGRNLSEGVPQKPFEVPPLPDEVPPIDELLERRKRQFARKAAAKEARKLIPVRVNVTGPFGIAHFGDPHVDDDGTDIGLLQRHISVINRTEAMFAGNVGDMQNNWVGRLAHLHSQQSINAVEAWELVKWMIHGCDWLYLVGGNHDAWSGTGDPLDWIAGQQGALLEPAGVRLGLNLPDGRTVRVNARHDFKGHSQWNTAHGPSKAAQMGWRDHILCCGHLHTSGYAPLKDPATGLITRAFRVASYKTYDRYAEEKGLPDQNIFVCPVTIIDPKYPDDDARFIHFVEDPEEGADYLTWKRARKAA